MALAESTHHTSRGQRNATAGRWVRDLLHGEVPGQPTSQPELFQLFEEEPGGSRPPCLGEPQGPQEVQQCTVEQLADVVPMVQILDTPGLLEEDQVVEVLRKLDLPAVEQVIAVPLISLDRVPQRSAIRRPQKAEQLVEVPTEPGYPLAVPCRACPWAEGCNGTGGADRGQPSSSGSAKEKLKSSSFFPMTGFNNECGADRRYSCSWRSPRFSPRPGFLIASISPR